MPELPEVETVCRGLAPRLTGRRLARVTVRRAGLPAGGNGFLCPAREGARLLFVAEAGDELHSQKAAGRQGCFDVGNGWRSSSVRASGHAPN